MKSLSSSLSLSLSSPLALFLTQTNFWTTQKRTNERTYSDIRSNVLNLFILIHFGLSLPLCYFSINISSGSSSDTETEY